jgi:hypothetical protein
MDNRCASSVRWVAWLPILFVTAMLFWTVALGLGGLSLMAVSALSDGQDDGASQAAGVAPTATEPMPGQSGQAAAADGIVVHLQESIEPEDVDDNVGAVPPALGDPNDDGTGHLSAHN